MKMQCLIKNGLLFVLLLIPIAFAATITDDATFQNGTFTNTTSNSTGVFLTGTELTTETNTVDLLHFYGNTNWTNNSKFGNSAVIFDGGYAKADQHFLNTANSTIEFWFRLSQDHI